LCNSPLHNKAREQLFENYEKTHNAEEIARTFPRIAPGTGKMSANGEKTTLSFADLQFCPAPLAT